ncbi:hypothetical protein [Chitinophaga sp. CB10]|uniref:hypothetical protein n=1 Tax=Chitinophaga sp. CB10 TaxID=1891659 RepID=UPI0025BA714D|nr:hypothetical protein [Chitinophaga sp. CB10]
MYCNLTSESIRADWPGAGEKRKIFEILALFSTIPAQNHVDVAKKQKKSLTFPPLSLKKAIFALQKAILKKFFLRTHSFFHIFQKKNTKYHPGSNDIQRFI